MKKLVLTALATILWGYILFYIINLIVPFTGNNDFPAFYRAARTILDPTVSNLSIYELEDSVNRYDIPWEFVPFRYAMLIAYMLSPLGLLPFMTAKAVFATLNICLFIASVVIFLKTARIKGRWYIYLFAMTWMPFIQNIHYVQINAVIMFLLALSLLFISNSSISSGAILGLSSLNKPYLLPVAMVFGLKNWRIITGFMAFISIALLLPGTREWFRSFLYPPHPAICYPFFYIQLGNWFYALAIVIGLVTAATVYTIKEKDNLKIFNFAMPSSFLVLPVVESHHLIVLVLPYIYLFFKEQQSRWRLAILLFSYVCVYMGSSEFLGKYFIPNSLTIGLSLLWLTMLLRFWFEFRTKLFILVNDED